MRITVCFVVCLVVTSLLAPVGAGQANQQQPIEIRLGAAVSGWQGQSGDVAGVTNPTLQLQAGQQYAITWSNLDGVPHNLAITDATGNVLARTEIVGEQGATRTLVFTATESMAGYRCEVHPQTMSGGVQVSQQGQPQTTSLGNETTSPGNETTAAVPNESAVEREPNDDPENATLVVPGTNVSGVLEGVTDVDGYTFEVTAGEQIRVEISRPTNAVGTLLTRLYDTNLTPVTSLRTVRRGETVILQAVAQQSGRYHVSVESADGAVGRYSVRVGSQSEAQPETIVPPNTTEAGRFVESEPNDNAQNANEILPNRVVSGTLSDVDDLDGFAIELEAGETVTVELGSFRAGGTLGVLLLDPNLQLVEGVPVPGGGQDQFQVRVQETGTYYVVVSSLTGSDPAETPGIGEYSIRVVVGGATNATTTANETTTSG